MSLIFAEDEFYQYVIEIKKIKKRNQKDDNESHSHYVSRKATEKYRADDQFKARAKMRYYKNLYNDNSFFQEIMNKDIKDSDKFEQIKSFHNSQKNMEKIEKENLKENQKQNLNKERTLLKLNQLKLNQLIPTYIN